MGKSSRIGDYKLCRSCNRIIPKTKLNCDECNQRIMANLNALGDTRPLLNQIITLEEEIKFLRRKLRTMRCAAYHSMLEITAWLGIDENKRHKKIAEHVEELEYIEKATPEDLRFQK